MEKASSASLKKMEIDTSSSAKSSSSMDCSPAGSKCSSAKSLMDEDITPEKTTTTTVLTPMDCSYKASSSVASSPSINSPIAASAGSDSSILPPKKKKKAELTWELNEDGVKVYTLRCGCGDIQRLMASEGNILRITNL